MQIVAYSTAVCRKHVPCGARGEGKINDSFIVLESPVGPVRFSEHGNAGEAGAGGIKLNIDVRNICFFLRKSSRFPDNDDVFVTGSHGNSSAVGEKCERFRIVIVQSGGLEIAYAETVFESYPCAVFCIDAIGVGISLRILSSHVAYGHGAIDINGGFCT